jgi:hypothetical protein
VALKPDKHGHVTTNRAPPQTDDLLLPIYHPWPPPIDHPHPPSSSTGIIHPLCASESPPLPCTRRPPLQERALLGRTTCLVPDAPETPLVDPALGPLASDDVVSRRTDRNGSVRDYNLFHLLCLLYFQVSFIFT